MNVRVGVATDIGQVREGNEDAYLVVAPLYAVADGMGGHRGGEVASSLALETVQGLFERHEGTLPDQVVQANRAVFERSQNDRSVSGMGTTLTAALIDGSEVHLVHVGDSRAYLLHGRQLTQLTEDHTLVHRMVVEGEITAEEAETHPHRSILTRALGVDEDVQVDQGDVRVQGGDRILLCTDGLTGMVPEEQIQEILADAPDPQDAVDRLVKLANRAGGIDNITAVVLSFDEDGRGPGATKEAAIPRQPAAERPVPTASPTERADMTTVGAAMRPPKDSASTSASASSASASPRTTSEAPQAPLTGPRRSRADRHVSSNTSGAASSPARSAGSPRSSGPPRHTGRKVGVWAGVTVSVLVLGVVGLRLFVDTQWYVGVSNGRVAIFRGVPSEVAGFELHSVVVETSIPASQAQALYAYRNLPEGITTDDREGANAVVEQIRTDLAKAEQPTS